MSFDTDHPFVLTATCESRMGTTARVTTFLASRRFYIVEMQQFDDTISQRFFVRVTFCAVQGEKVDLADLRQQFREVADVEQMEWQIHDSRERTRVLIMVSNYDHCLEDLLYRHRIGELAMDITAIVSNHVSLQPVAAHNRIPFFHLPVTAQTKPEQERKLIELIDSTRRTSWCSRATCRFFRTTSAASCAAVQSTSITRSCRVSRAPSRITRRTTAA